MMLKTITSKENKTLKEVRSLLSKKGRDKENLFIVEGYKFIFSDSLYKPKYIIFSEETYENVLLENPDISNVQCDIYIVPKDIFKTLTDTETPQGSLCVFHFNNTIKNDVIDLLKEKENLSILVCEEMQDPGNCGTIIRTADAAAFDMCIFTEKSVDYYNPKAVRSSAGSILNIPCFYFKTSMEVIELLKEFEITTYGTFLNTNLYYDSIKYPKKTAFFLGNEANGLKDTTINMLETLVKIPILGKAESLNVSIAGSLMIYEILKQNKLY
ncbi:MAG: TrmH family RNA methyltransferase [Lachnospirales bacterium]